MKTILKDKSFGVKIAKIQPALKKWQRFKDIFLYGKCPAISLTVKNLGVSILLRHFRMDDKHDIYFPDKITFARQATRKGTAYKCII